MTTIHAVTMPKWGLSMTHGKVVDWLIDEGTPVGVGAEVLEVETEKITSAVEAPAPGVLRRRVAGAGVELPVGALLGVIAAAEVPDTEIDEFVTDNEDVIAVEDAGESGPEPESVEVAGRMLRFLRRGEGGPPALMIHGFGSNLNTWLFNHEPLSVGREVYALDLPGHGQSSKEVGDGTIAHLADVVMEWLDVVGIPQVHLVGHSLGGAICLEIACRAPARVLSLTLVSSAGLGSEIAADYVHGFVQAERRNQLKPHLQQLFFDPTQVTRQVVDETLRSKRLDGVSEALTTIASAFVVDGQQPTRFAGRLAEIQAPKLVLWGADDRILPAAHAAVLDDQATVHVLDDCGHMVHMEGARDVNRLVDQFWQS